MTPPSRPTPRRRSNREVSPPSPPPKTIPRKRRNSTTTHDSQAAEAGPSSRRKSTKKARAGDKGQDAGTSEAGGAAQEGVYKEEKEEYNPTQLDGGGDVAPFCILTGEIGSFIIVELKDPLIKAFARIGLECYLVTGTKCELRIQPGDVAFVEAWKFARLARAFEKPGAAQRAWAKSFQMVEIRMFDSAGMNRVLGIFEKIENFPGWSRLSPRGQAVVKDHFARLEAKPYFYHMTLDLTLPSKRGTTPQERAMYATIAMYGVKYNDYRDKMLAWHPDYDPSLLTKRDPDYHSLDPPALAHAIGDKQLEALQEEDPLWFDSSSRNDEEGSQVGDVDRAGKQGEMSVDETMTIGGSDTTQALLERPAQASGEVA